MRRLPYSGLLLLVLGFLGLAGYLTGNLDRWLQAAFGGAPPPSSSPAPSVGSGAMARPSSGSVRAA